MIVKDSGFWGFAGLEGGPPPRRESREVPRRRWTSEGRASATQVVLVGLGALRAVTLEPGGGAAMAKRHEETVRSAMVPSPHIARRALLALVSAATLAIAGLVGCTEDAPGAGECVSSADCAHPAALCDGAGGRCVECLETAQCAHAPGTVCSLGACVCADGSTDCAPPIGPAPDCLSNVDCAYPTAICHPAEGRCVGCLVLSDCANMPGTVCSEGACVCPGGDTYCGPDTCVDTNSDADHCGACDRGCFDRCGGGSCATPWARIPTLGGPTPRAGHVAVWTGTEMIVWGGATGSASGFLGDGARFNPATNRWSPMSRIGAPSPRRDATAVWTGSEMIVWGGDDGAARGDGARYDPATDTWRPMTQTAAPSNRHHHTAIWTGSHMLVFGGVDADQLSTGGRYDPVADGWAALRSVPTPNESRSDHTAVWDGARMLVYGGFGDSPGDFLTNLFLPGGTAPGGRSYEPTSGAWAALQAANTPGARAHHTAVWTGDAMVVWGGRASGSVMNDGAQLRADVWSSLRGTPPVARSRHSATWLEGAGVMVVYGGTDGVSAALSDAGVYDASINSWVEMVPGPIPGRWEHSAVPVADDALIVWGGRTFDGAPLGDGAMYSY